MEGPDVFKFAVDIFIRQANEVCNAAGVSMEDIDLWVPHQANFRIIDAAARRIGLPLERVAINIDEYGNTSSARSRWRSKRRSARDGSRAATTSCSQALDRA